VAVGGQRRHRASLPIGGQPDNRTNTIGLEVTGDAALYAIEGKLGWAEHHFKTP
jgi:hypothetical protein